MGDAGEGSLVPVAERTCADAVVDGEAIFRVIIGIDKELPGTVQELVAIAGQVAQA